jgi:hypothetical protein
LEKQRRPVENRSDVALCHRSERLINLIFGANTDNEQRLSNGLRCRLHFLDLKRRRIGIRVDHKGDRARFGQYFTQKPQAFRSEFSR